MPRSSPLVLSITFRNRACQYADADAPDVKTVNFLMEALRFNPGSFIHVLLARLTLAAAASRHLCCSEHFLSCLPHLEYKSRISFAPP